MTNQKCLDFINWFDDVLNEKPAMLGSVSDISAMFYVVDNIKHILLFDERLPQQLSWNEFLVDRKLVQDMKPIPVEENWDLESLAKLRHQYLKWLEVRCAEIS
jgi:hypothetical protein